MVEKMILSDKQKEAIKLIEDWFKGKTQEFVVAGYAGAGKTTIAKFIAQDISNTVFCAYTGKAANVLREKGCEPAGTIHGFLYSISDADKKKIQKLETELQECLANNENKAAAAIIDLLELLKKPKFSLNMESDLKLANLVIVDEYSMLDSKIITDLRKVCRKILYLGDPFQLPPITGECSLQPDLFLTEVHRQALDSPIIRAATDVREGRRLNFCIGDAFTFARKRDIAPEIFLNADQVIVGRNNTRTAWNKRFREIKGYAEKGILPQVGEKVICLKNNHIAGLFNGMIETVAKESVQQKGYYDLYLDGYSLSSFYQVWDGDIIITKEKYNFQNYFHRALERFDYAWCITAHKSQGSEFNDVVVYNEPIGNALDRQKWLYTSITRAKNKLTLVQPE